MARSGVCQHCHRGMLPRQITQSALLKNNDRQSALLKNNDRGNKKALIRKPTRASFAAGRFSKSEPSSNVCCKAISWAPCEPGSCRTRTVRWHTRFSRQYQSVGIARSNLRYASAGRPLVQTNCSLNVSWGAGLYACRMRCQYFPVDLREVPICDSMSQRSIAMNHLKRDSSTGR